MPPDLVTPPSGLPLPPALRHRARRLRDCRSAARRARARPRHGVPLPRGAGAAWLTTNGTPLLEVRDLSMHFPAQRLAVRRRVRHADRRPASGGRRRSDGRARRGARSGGRVGLREVDARALHRRPLRAHRRAGARRRARAALPGAAAADRRRLQMVFQDPYSSLNPRMTVHQAIGELLRVHNVVPREPRGRALSRAARPRRAPAERAGRVSRGSSRAGSASASRSRARSRSSPRS